MGFYFFDLACIPWDYQEVFQNKNSSLPERNSGKNFILIKGAYNQKWKGIEKSFERSLPSSYQYFMSQSANNRFLQKSIYFHCNDNINVTDSTAKYFKGSRFCNVRARISCFYLDYPYNGPLSFKFHYYWGTMGYLLGSYIEINWSSSPYWAG